MSQKAVMEVHFRFDSFIFAVLVQTRTEYREKINKERTHKNNVCTPQRIQCQPIFFEANIATGTQK